MGNDGTPSGARKDWHRRRNFHLRRTNDSGQCRHCGFGSVRCSTRALDRVVDGQVMTQVKRLQREACGKQTQDRYLCESWDHRPSASVGMPRH